MVSEFQIFENLDVFKLEEKNGKNYCCLCLWACSNSMKSMRKVAPTKMAFILTSRSFGNVTEKTSASVNPSRKQPLHFFVTAPITFPSIVSTWRIGFKNKKIQFSSYQDRISSFLIGFTSFFFHFLIFQTCPNGNIFSSFFFSNSIFSSGGLSSFIFSYLSTQLAFPFSLRGIYIAIERFFYGLK